jgi:hypothetical protein
MITNKYFANDTLKKAIVSFLTLFCVVVIHAEQPYCSLKDIASKYLIEKGELPSDYKDCISIFDLISNHQIENLKTIGIYRFQACSAHATSYIIIAEQQQYQILNLKSIDDDLIKIITYAEKCKMPSADIIKCIKHTINLYQWNHKIINRLNKNDNNK